MQFTEIFTRMGDNPAENLIENVLGLLPPQPSQIHPVFFHKMEHKPLFIPKSHHCHLEQLIYVTIAMKPHKISPNPRPTFPSQKKANWQKRGKTLPDTPLIDLLLTQTLVVSQMSKPDRLRLYYKKIFLTKFFFNEVFPNFVMLT